MRLLETLALLFIGTAATMGAGFALGAIPGSVAGPVAVVAIVGAIVTTAPDRTL